MKSLRNTLLITMLIYSVFILGCSRDNIADVTTSIDSSISTGSAINVETNKSESCTNECCDSDKLDDVNLDVMESKFNPEIIKKFKLDESGSVKPAVIINDKMYDLSELGGYEDGVRTSKINYEIKIPVNPETEIYIPSTENAGVWFYQRTYNAFKEYERMFFDSNKKLTQEDIGSGANLNMVDYFRYSTPIDRRETIVFKFGNPDQKSKPFSEIESEVTIIISFSQENIDDKIKAEVFDSATILADGSTEDPVIGKRTSSEVLNLLKISKFSYDSDIAKSFEFVPKYHPSESFKDIPFLEDALIVNGEKYEIKQMKTYEEVLQTIQIIKADVYEIYISGSSGGYSTWRLEDTPEIMPLSYKIIPGVHGPKPDFITRGGGQTIIYHKFIVSPDLNQVILKYPYHLYAEKPFPEIKGDYTIKLIFKDEPALPIP